MTPPATTLGGALIRRPDAASWEWRDGTPAAPMVRDMTMANCAPSFRVCGGHVEIPKRWLSNGLWPQGVADPDAVAAIRRLIAVHGRSGRIYADGLAELRDDHRLTRDGYRVPVDAWDATMGQSCGAEWDARDEATVLGRAYDLGWRPPTADYVSPHGWRV